MWRDDAYLLDMLLAARDIRRHTKGVDWQRFLGDEILQNAIMHLIQIIGEAARNVPDDFAAAHPEVPWARIAGLRNRIVHDYFGLDLEIIWQILQVDLPQLKSQLPRCAVSSSP